jgi:hypothetical protein
VIGTNPPVLSIVIAATDSAGAVAIALEALEGQGPGRIEILVVAASEMETTAVLCRVAHEKSLAWFIVGWVSTQLFGCIAGSRPSLPVCRTARDADENRCSSEPTPVPFSEASWLVAEAGSGVPRLRRIGLEAARGRVVAFLEDSCVARPGWAEAWIAAFEDPELVAASGLVEHDDQDASLLDRAVVFCEYAPFLPPARTGRPGRLAGNNFAVLREVALKNSASEVHETALLASVRGAVRIVERAIVRHVRRFDGRAAFGDRFRFGLEYGRLRTVGAPPIVRWAGLVAGPAIFGAQVIRLAGTIFRNRRYLARFVESLPITLALLATWSLGEWLGWTLGPPGRRRPRPTVRKPHERAGRTPEQRPDPAGSPRANYSPGPPLA